MTPQNQTWNLHRKILAIIAVLLISTSANAQEVSRTVAEIQADISRLQTDLTLLQAELQKAEWDATRNADPDAYLYISLIDTADKPIAGAKATLTYRIEKEDKPQTLETTSNAKGEVLFPPITEADANEESEFVLHIEKDNLVPIESKTSLAHFSRRSASRLPLFETAKMEEAVRLIGRFVQESGDPIPDVSLLAQRAGLFYGSGFRYYSPPAVRGDGEGTFSILVHRSSLLRARHADFVPKRFSVTPAVRRTADSISEVDLGDIVLKSGEFRPTIQVLDREGKPVSDRWVNLRMVHSQEEADLYARNPRSRSPSSGSPSDFFNADSGELLVTDAEGKATFGPAETGRYYIETGGRLGGSPLPMSMYPILPKTVELSPDVPTATVQESKIINVTVQFSDNTTTPERERRTVIYGSTLTFLDGSTTFYVPGIEPRYLGEGQFRFQLPDQLQAIELVLDSPFRAVDSRSRINNELSYRVLIGGKVVEPSGRLGRLSFPLEKIYDGQRIEVISYKSPKITLNVVDEQGEPIREFVAGAQYAKREQAVTFKQADSSLRVADPTFTATHQGSGRTRIHFWNQVNSDALMVLDMDVEFAWRNFGEDTAKVNLEAILPDEELRLYVVGRGYEVFEQTLKLTEGEEQELTIVLKK